MTIFRFDPLGLCPRLRLPRDISIQKKGRAAVLACALVWGGVVTGQEIAVPSGIAMTLYDVRLEDDPAVARFRLVSAALDPAGEGRVFADLVEDLQYVCDRVVLPSLAANAWPGTSIVISVSDVQTEFGVFDDSVTQFFQPYQLDGDTCIWENF